MASSSSVTTETVITVPLEPSYQLPREPANSISRELPHGPGRSIEMQSLPYKNAAGGVSSPPNSPPNGISHAPSPNLIVDRVQSVWEPYKNRFRVLSCCFTGLANGMNDAASGALLASIEKHYEIGYGTVSIIFVCNAIGFIAAALFVNSLASKIGRAKTLIISETFLILGYTILATTPPFAAVVISFFLTGTGMAINLAISQVFCACLANNTAMIGIYQGAYGIGGTVSPLIATAMISNGWIWSRFYILELCVAVFNLFFAPWAFWGYEIESDPALPAPSSNTNMSYQRNSTTKTSNRKWQSFKRLASNKPTILGSCFMFVYQGAEVAISGWIISFLVQFRNSDPSKVGYVTSGFWGGITLGRFTLSFLAHRIGERLFVFLATIGALILEILIWFVPSIPGASVSVAISGFLLGPISPCSVHVLQRLVPPKMMISSLSLVGSVGSSGGAVAPFMTGMIAQSQGTFVLHPICIGLFVAMCGTWWALPEVEKREA